MVYTKLPKMQEPIKLSFSTYNTFGVEFPGQVSGREPVKQTVNLVSINLGVTFD